ncbi:hypothetical protein 2 [Beihai toti-like virus 4]|uniref:hypothetical protein 2 n=1 Tax=Beihai toti-like virus 4 TaxID=1922734 RepID=UPI00090CA83A|nr:hypothetical protein 2 [Beihai toti-like virus 4]APG76008.1 hypothetical protein 2 [Beihai toti-like virus 4]
MAENLKDIKVLYPDYEMTESMWLDIVNIKLDKNDFLNDLTEDSNVPGISYFSSYHVNRIRQMPPMYFEQEFKNYPLTLKFCFSLLLQLHPVYRDIIISVLYAVNILPNCLTVTKYIEVCKKLTSWAKKCNSLASRLINNKFNCNVEDKFWMILVDWDIFSGYNFKYNESKIIDSIKEWGSGDIYKGNNEVSSDKYYKLMEKYVDKLLEFGTLEKKNILSLRDWLSDPTKWVTAGSSNGVRVDIFSYDKNRNVKSAATKSVFSVKYDVDDLYKILMTNTKPQDSRVNIKLEAGQKNRIIVSSGWVNQLRMAYISSWLEKSLKNVPWTTLFSTNQDAWTRNVRKCSHIKSGSIMFPLDAKNFDQNVSKGEIDVCFNSIRKIINKSLAGEKRFDCLKLIDIIQNQFWNTFVVYKNMRMLWEHGMPSGIRWTAFLDTLINAARVCIINDILSKGSTIPIKEYTAQGDDDDLEVSKWDDILNIFNTYNSLGIVLAPQKNFVSTKMTEFLRKVYFSDLIMGYITRKMVNVCFVNPEKNLVNYRDVDLHTIRDIWLELMQRGGDFEYCESKLIEHIALVLFNKLGKIEGYSKLTDRHLAIAKDVLSTPASLGGLGCLWFGTRTWRVLQEKRSERHYQLRGPLGVWTKVLSATNSVTGNVRRENEAVIRDKIVQTLIPKHERVPRIIECELLEIPFSGLIQVPEITPSLQRTLPVWRMRDDIGPVDVNCVLNACKENRDWGLLRSITSESVLGTFDNMLSSKHKRELLITWVMDDWTVNAPSHRVWGKTALSAMFVGWKNYCINRWYEVNNKGRDYYTKLCVSSEYNFYKYVNTHEHPVVMRF